MLDQARTSTADRFVQLVEHVSDEEFEQLLAVAREALRAITARSTNHQEPPVIPTIACRECGTDAPDDEACGDPCCSRCSHPAKAVR